MRISKLAGWITGCLSMGIAVAGTINYEGSSTIGKYVSSAGAVYTASKFNINVVPESSGGEQCAMRGSCDLGGVARVVNPEVLNKDVVATLIAYDAIAAIVHNENPVKELSSAQLKDIFSGKIKNWSEVGGADLPIKPFVVKEASATREVFAKAILGDTPYQNVEVATPDATMVPRVAKEKGGIGQISLLFLMGQTQVKPLIVNGQNPVVDNPNYPIKRPLYFTTKGEPKGEVKAFLEWTLAPAGQAVIKQSFIGVK